MEAPARFLMVALTIASVASAGCVGSLTDDTVDTSSVEEMPDAAGGVTTENLEGAITAAATTPALSLNNGGAFSFPITFGGNVTGFVLELDWEASTPASEELDLWVREGGAGSIPPSSPEAFPPPAPLAKATGGSILRLAVSAADFPAEGEYDVIVRAPSPGGAAVDQTFHLHVTTFDGVPFDPDHVTHEG